MASGGCAGLGEGRGIRRFGARRFGAREIPRRCSFLLVRQECTQEKLYYTLRAVPSRVPWHQRYTCKRTPAPQRIVDLEGVRRGHAPPP